MPCCGKKRQMLGRGSPERPRPRSVTGGPPVPPRGRASALRFQYVGRTALQVRGSWSGRLYNFERPGAILMIDPRDRRGMEKVPKLVRHGAEALAAATRVSVVEDPFFFLE